MNEREAHPSYPPPEEQAPPVPLEDWGEPDTSSSLEEAPPTSFIQKIAKMEPPVSPRTFSESIRESVVPAEFPLDSEQAPPVDIEELQRPVLPREETRVDERLAAEREKFYQDNPHLRPNKEGQLE